MENWPNDKLLQHMHICSCHAWLPPAAGLIYKLILPILFEHCQFVSPFSGYAISSGQLKLTYKESEERVDKKYEEGKLKGKITTCL